MLKSSSATSVLPTTVAVVPSYGPRSGACFSTNTAPLSMPMKAGTPIPGLDIFKDQDPPVALERSEYPDWVGTLSQPLISLSKLRKMPEEEATDKDKRRYLKLVRRLKVKENNEEAKAK